MTCHSDTGDSKFIWTVTGSAPAVACTAICAGVFTWPVVLGVIVADTGRSGSGASARTR